MFVFAHAQCPFHQVCCDLGYCVALNEIMKHVVDVRNGNRSMPQKAGWSDKTKLKKSQVDVPDHKRILSRTRQTKKKHVGKKEAAAEVQIKLASNKRGKRTTWTVQNIRWLLRGRCYRKKWTCCLIYLYSGVDFPDESVSACWSTNKRRHRVNPECITRIFLI